MRQTTFWSLAMILSSRLSLSDLIEMCRSLRHYLGAGLPLVDAFRQQAKRGGSAVRPVAGRIVEGLQKGDSLEDTLQREAVYFPPLFLSLTRVGEQTGLLAEVFAELEKYYVRQQKLWRHFYSQIAWPTIQFVLAIFVLALLILIMGMIHESRGGPELDPLGLGLSGSSGAIIFLSVVFSVLLAMAFTYWLVTRSVRSGAALQTYLLGLPALGPCLRALALTRFCMALRLTTETGMSIVKAVRLSLQATGNDAFATRSETIEAELRRGQDLTLALTKSGLFPEDFQHMMTVAEESGTLDQVLAHQTEHYHEESSRRLAVLTNVAAYGVWAFVGLVIIFAIFRIYSWYISQLAV
jgi:type IV pilus assembly protein PilC